jgi:SSS family solute:Na+ symporter/sodium/pantothenate symporter
MGLAWTLFLLYLLGTSYLGWLGLKKTDGFSSFAIGKGDLSPLKVGVTLAAATASAATFIINPGFVYVDGLAAFMHLGISVYVGFVLMLLLLSFRFRELGASMHALTIPDWIGKRYDSPNFSLYFAVINLLSFAFIVLLVGGISIVMQQLLDITNFTALVITLVFVTGYVLIGGTYAHVYTNMLQGFLMVGVSVLVIASGIVLMLGTEDFWGAVAGAGENLLGYVNPDSRFYRDIFSTYVAGFCIGGALVCQPHILTKALYVKTNREVGQYIAIFSGVYLLFTLLLLVGFWAHISVPAGALADPVTGAFRQDLVMTAYLRVTFPDWLFTIVGVVLLAAAMSTLDGLLVGISTITASDLVLNLLRRYRPGDEERQLALAMRVSQVVLVVVAVAAFFVALHPPPLLGIFGQVGVYGLVLAAVPPLLAGVLFDRVHKSLVWGFSVLALLVHFSLYLYGEVWFPDTELAFANPGVTAAIALLLTALPSTLISWALRRRPPLQKE